jgi:hypothetical protein
VSGQDSARPRPSSRRVRFPAKKEQLWRGGDISPASQDQDPVLTVLCVPSSLDPVLTVLCVPSSTDPVLTVLCVPSSPISGPDCLVCAKFARQRDAPGSRTRVCPTLGFRVSGSGIRASGFWLRVPPPSNSSGFRFRVSGFGSRVSGFGFRISSYKFRVSGFGF